MRSPLLHSALFSLALLSVACGGPLRYDVAGGALAPGADVHLIAAIDEAANVTRITLKIENLLPPERIDSDATTFVGWTRKDSDSAWTRIGALKYDEDDRVAELVETSVAELSFTLLVTAEEDAAPESPGDKPIFSQEVSD